MSGVVFCDKTPDLPRGHLVIVDGKSALTGADYLRCVGEQLDFPDAQTCNWDGYLDWMQDLSWIEEKTVSVVVLNYDDFLSRDPDSRQCFVSDFEKIISHDSETAKDITVYCVRGDFPQQVQVKTKDVVSMIRRGAMNGQKTPHSTSQPVLRMHDGKLCFAAFVFFFNREQLQCAMVGRPSMWVVGDIETGEIVQRYLCTEMEFSNSPYERFYNISSRNLPSVGAGYWDSAYALMDMIREEYAAGGTLNLNLYGRYLTRILETSPEEYRVFYTDLNNIEMEDNSMDTETKIPAEEVEEQAPEIQQAPEVPGEAVAFPDEAEAPAGELLEKLEAIQQALSELQQAFDDKIAADTHKNGLFDNMHRELIRYQNGALDKLVDTVALDIIQLIDTTKGHVRVYDKKEPTEENYKKLLRIVKGIAEDLEDILYRQNIEAYRVPGHEVDVRRQKIIQTVPTDDQTKDNLIAVRAADGYEKGDKILRPERIKIFKYEAAPETPTEN